MNIKHKLELNFKSAVGFFSFFSSTNVETKNVCPIAYNFAFDSKIVDGEAWRLWGKYFITNKPHFCTMQNTTDLLQIPGPYGYKFPKLMELHEYLFDQSFDGAHDALADVTATMNCYFELEKRGLINKILLP